MARFTEPNAPGGAPIPAIMPEDRMADDLDRHEAGRSNFGAFLLGGLVIAGGLMAFLYYDNGQASRSDDIVTGSIIRTEPLTAPNVRLVPEAPKQLDTPAKP